MLITLAYFRTSYTKPQSSESSADSMIWDSMEVIVLGGGSQASENFVADSQDIPIDTVNTEDSAVEALSHSKEISSNFSNRDQQGPSTSTSSPSLTPTGSVKRYYSAYVINELDYQVKLPCTGTDA